MTDAELAVVDSTAAAAVVAAAALAADTDRVLDATSSTMLERRAPCALGLGIHKPHLSLDGLRKKRQGVAAEDKDVRRSLGLGKEEK